jgi:hypothetical protein
MLSSEQAIKEKKISEFVENNRRINLGNFLWGIAIKDIQPRP